jgi:uncharacterized protein (TIGR03067 family)
MTGEEPTTPSLNATQTQGEVESQNVAPERQETPSRRRPRRLGRVAVIVLLVGMCGTAAWYWGIREPEPKDDLGRFQGEWKLTLRERGRKEADETPPGSVVHVTGDRLYFDRENRGKSLRIKLDETASPKEIELTLLDPDGNPVGAYGSHGIYTVDRKTARLVVELVNRPRPKDFDSPDAVVWVLSR